MNEADKNISLSPHEGEKYFHLLTDKLREIIDRPVKIMEVCGTHTMAIGKAGIRHILPPEVELISGPGCPVCVTADEDIDAFLQLAGREGLIAATYGDMMRVPGSKGSLDRLKSEGADVRVVYSAMEALDIARREQNKEVVFFGVGFETTAPAAAYAVKTAMNKGVTNFSVYNLHKTVPEALKLLLEDEGTQIDGFILPGHVSVIIGADAYGFIPTAYGVAGSIAGFEPPQIMASLLKLVQDIQQGTPQISNLYGHVVRPEGNRTAQQLLEEIFSPCDAKWRGLGVIPGSGLMFREHYAEYDAASKFGIETKPVQLQAGCRCGDILKGAIKPHECPLFAGRCKPDKPVGPCMVSSEGTCASYFMCGGAEQ